MPVPNTFANATTSIPLSQLDANFATPITLGNTAIQLGNTVTTLNNMTLANVTVNSGNLTTSTVTVGAGSNTAPSITFSGDTNTGIYSPAADTIAFSEGGVEAMRLDASGNVGIGTSSPSTRLSVQTGATQDAVRWTDNINSTGLLSTIAGASTIYTTTALAFGTGSGSFTERMRIDSAGRVGIGTSSPGAFLDVASAGASSAGLNIRTFNSTDGVGAGALTIIKFGSTAAPYGPYAANNVGVNSAFTNLLFGTETAHNAIFYTSNTERMRIDASGNVGIGTSLPGNRLDIVNAGTSQIRVKDGVGATAYYDFGRDGTDGFFGFSGAQATFSGYKWSVNAGTEVMRITNVGNVGIGTGATPGYRLDVAFAGDNGARIRSSTLGSYLVFENVTGAVVANSSNTPLSFTTANLERMRITADGNVGIGTSSPQQRLNVGSATGVNIIRVDGGNSTNNEGSGIFFAQGGTTRIAIGNSSAVLGGAYNQDALYYAETNTVFMSGGFNERMRINTSGNVGIGTSSPATRLDVVGNARVITTSSGVAATFGTNDGGANNNALLVVPTYGNGVVSANGIYLDMGTAGMLGFRATAAGVANFSINSGGDALFSKLTNSDTTVGASVLTNGRVTSTMASSTGAESSYHLYSTGAGAYRFYVDLSGRIAATNTTIAAISDQRLKENIRDLDAGLPEVMALKPRKFDWKPGKGKDKKDDQGWIAQEFEQVFPDMITEWKDPAPEGEEPYKAVGADLIPVLVKAIQQQQAQIETLKARVAALENK